MTLESHITRAEKALLREIKQSYSREECIQIWYDLRDGFRKIVPISKTKGGFWEKYRHRKYVVEAFVREFQQEHSDLEKILKFNKVKYKIKPYPGFEDFVDAKLLGLLSGHYGSSPLSAFVEAGFTNPKSKNYDRALAEAPWLVLANVPNNYWDNKGNRVKAIKWLANVLNKSPSKISHMDFEDNYLGGLLGYHGSSVFKALKEAGFKLKGKDMYRVPKNYWKKKENRIRAVKDLVRELSKQPEEITLEDFENNGLSGLLRHHRFSTILILREAYGEVPELSLRHVPHGYWQNKKNRVKATRELVAKLGKPVSEITRKDFYDNSLRGLLVYHKDSHKLALKETGYKI